MKKKNNDVTTQNKPQKRRKKFQKLQRSHDEKSHFNDDENQRLLQERVKTDRNISNYDNQR